MPRYVFRIGEAFRADDPIARFVTVLAMIHNDWLRSMAFMQESVEQHPEEGQGIRLILVRQQFATTTRPPRSSTSPEATTTRLAKERR